MINPFKFVLRLMIVSAAVFWLNSACEKAIVNALIPVIRFTLQHVQSDFVIQSVDIADEAPNENLRVRANLAYPQEIGGRTFFPIGYGTPYTGGYQATITVGGVVIYSVMMLITALSWPAMKWQEWASRILLAMPLMLAMILINVAITIPAQLWVPIHDAWVPDISWTLLDASKLLMGGAGLVIALGLGAMIILVCRDGLLITQPVPSTADLVRHPT